MARKKARRCKFGVNKRTKACLKSARPRKAGSRRRKVGSRKRRSYSAKGGSYCVTTTKPRTGRGRGGLAFSTTCFKSKDAALSALKARSKGAYTAMLHRPGKGKR